MRKLAKKKRREAITDSLMIQYGSGVDCHLLLSAYCCKADNSLSTALCTISTKSFIFFFVSNSLFIVSAILEWNKANNTFCHRSRKRGCNTLAFISWCKPATAIWLQKTWDAQAINATKRTHKECYMHPQFSGVKKWIKWRLSSSWAKTCFQFHNFMAFRVLTIQHDVFLQHTTCSCFIFSYS